MGCTLQPFMKSTRHELGPYLVLRSIFCPQQVWTLKGCPLPHGTSFFSAVLPERPSFLAFSTSQWPSDVQFYWFLHSVLLDLSIVVKAIGHSCNSLSADLVLCHFPSSSPSFHDPLLNSFSLLALWSNVEFPTTSSLLFSPLPSSRRPHTSCLILFPVCLWPSWCCL